MLSRKRRWAGRRVAVLCVALGAMCGCAGGRSDAWLHEVELLALPGAGAEDVAFGEDGSLYTGIEGGRIVRIAPGGEAAVIAETGGRPQGLAIDASGRLLIADAKRGLLAVGAEGALQTLLREAGGHRLHFANGLAIGPDGLVYLTDSSARHDVTQMTAAALSGDRTGRLIAYDPGDGAARVLLDDLVFANRVAVDPAGRFVLVSETFAYRVRRVWLTGGRAGEAEVLLDDLPGFPDNLAAGEDGLFYVALFAERDASLEVMQRLPMVAWLMMPVASRVAVEPRRVTRVLAFDGEGRIVLDGRDGAARYAPLTSARPRGGALYLVSTKHRAIGRVVLPRD